MEGSAGVAANRLHALDALEAGRRCDPGAMFERLLDRLRACPDAVAAALKGTPLHVRIALDGPRQIEGWVVFTGNGHVAVLGDDAMREERTSPDLLVQGTSRSVLAALLGLTSPGSALDAGVLIPMVPAERFAAVLSLVGEELLAVAADYIES